MEQYTISQILSDPSLIDQFSITECKHFVQEHARKQKPDGIKDLRDKARQRIHQYDKIQKDLKRGQENLENFNAFFVAMYDRFKNIWKEYDGINNYQDELTFTKHSRSIGNDLYDAGEIHLGLCRVNAYKQPANIITREHFWPRSIVSGRAIVTSIITSKDQFTIDMLIELCFIFSQVVTTTKKENELLVQYYKQHPFKSANKTYKDCNIQLVRMNEYKPPTRWTLLLKSYNIPEPNPYPFNELSVETAVQQGLIAV
jgi:hypothetical protein